jgi:hypothetical protein
MAIAAMVQPFTVVLSMRRPANQSLMGKLSQASHPKANMCSVLQMSSSRGINHGSKR